VGPGRVQGESSRFEDFLLLEARLKVTVKVEAAVVGGEWGRGYPR
jgi:hypothetical protein